MGIALHCLPRYGLAVGVKEVDRLLVALRMQQPLRMEPPERLQRLDGRMLPLCRCHVACCTACACHLARHAAWHARMQAATPCGVPGVLPCGIGMFV